jgi:hypothetical protein
LFASSFTAITQSLVPISMRAMAIACGLFVVNSFAIGLGPQIMGFASDFLRPHFGEESLRVTLIGSALVSLPAAFFYYLASLTYRAEIAVADAANNTSA